MTNLTIISPLEKIMHGEKAAAPFEGFSMLKNERKSFSAYIESSSDNLSVQIDSPLECTMYTVEYMPSEFPINEKTADDFVIRSKDGYYPDLLIPTDGQINMINGERLLWFEIYSKESLPVGKHKTTIRISDGEADVSKSIDVEVIDASLPKQELIFTDWFHTDCLMDEYGFEAFSDEYWRVVKNYLQIAVAHGMNCVLTPLFTPPLDTAVGGERPTVQLIGVKVEKGEYIFDFDNLIKWINTAHECGIEYFEFSHFFTQWGAKAAPKVMAYKRGKYKHLFGWKTSSSSHRYKKFLTDLSVELKELIEKLNLKDKVLIHVSDEPQLRHMRTYSHAAKLIHSLYGGYKIVDALSEFKYYSKGYVKTPIISNNHIEPYVDKVPEVWTYYCCGQDNKYVSNRFFSTPSVRNRVLGFQLYKYNAAGFLHWGYNFWYTRYSKKKINPYEITDAGGEFQSGDSYVVYPKKDGDAYVSLRLKVFYDGIQDMLALKKLESLTSREYAVELLEDNVNGEITFSKYPHSNEWLLNTREEINNAIKANLQNEK